jgi:hypothetical protein
MRHSMNLTRCVPFSVVLILCFLACTSGTPANPQQKLVGKWEEPDNPKTFPVQFEFLADGTAIKNQRLTGKFGDGKWHQEAAGTFKFVSPTRIKVELQPSWYFGVSLYELEWQDQDHVVFHAADKTIPLSRVKP